MREPTNSQRSYGFGTVLDIPFDAAVERTTEALKNEGFGVLTTIDVAQTLKEKLNVDFERYVILGACNPQLAYRGLQAEHEVGCSQQDHHHAAEERPARPGGPVRPTGRRLGERGSGSVDVVRHAGLLARRPMLPPASRPGGPGASPRADEIPRRARVGEREVPPGVEASDRRRRG